MNHFWVKSCEAFLAVAMPVWGSQIGTTSYSALFWWCGAGCNRRWQNFRWEIWNGMWVWQRYCAFQKASRAVAICLWCSKQGAVGPTASLTIEGTISRTWVLTTHARLVWWTLHLGDLHRTLYFIRAVAKLMILHSSLSIVEVPHVVWTLLFISFSSRWGTLLLVALLVIAIITKAIFLWGAKPHTSFRRTWQQSCLFLGCCCLCLLKISTRAGLSNISLFHLWKETNRKNAIEITGGSSGLQYLVRMDLPMFKPG